MGIPFNRPSYGYGDNLSVITNAQTPRSTLQKKSNSICYHAVREAVAMKELVVAHIRSEQNPSDIFTKVIGGGQKRKELVSMIIYNIYDDVLRVCNVRAKYPLTSPS